MLRLIVILVIAASLWLIFAPEMGIYSVFKKRSSLQVLKSEMGDLERQNEILKQDIERIQNDIEYLEQVARDKHGLLKENEMVFDFSGKNQKRKEEK